MQENLTGERSYVRNILSQGHATLILPPSYAPSSSPPPPIHKKLSPWYDDMILTSDEDDVGSVPQSHEVILVLNSDEEWEVAAKGPAIKQEHEVKIKMEPGVEHWMDGSMSKQQHHQHSGDSMESSGCKTDTSPQHHCQLSTSSIFYSDNEEPKWPQDYYVCDVVAVFKKPPHGISKKASFTMHFPGLQFKKSTFYDNYNLWIQTPVAFYMRYADYGHMEKGLWRFFLTAHVRYLERWHERQEKHKKQQVDKGKDCLLF
jgi:hypothetical protein